MDDELEQLEAELKALRPMPPSRELVTRIGRELGRTAGGASVALSADRREDAVSLATLLRWLVTFALPAAAVVAISMLPFSRDPARRADADGHLASRAGAVPLKPVAAENMLVSASDEGLVTLEDGTTARRARLQFVDTITWRNPRTNASLTWSVPREEVRVVPVSFQ